MRYRWCLAAGLVALLVIGAYAGSRVRTHPRYVTAQAAGTSSSGGGGSAGGQSGGSAGGQSGGSAGGQSGGSTTGGGGETGGGTGGGETGGGGTSGGGTGGGTGPGGGQPGGPPGAGAGSGSGGQATDDPPVTVDTGPSDGGLSPFSPTDPDEPGEAPPPSGPPISTPPTSAPPPSDEVADGRPVACPEGTESHIRCFQVDDPNASAVRVPDGQGGTVVVAPPNGPLVGDGFSTSAASNADLRVDVDVRTGVVVHVNRWAAVRQAVLATLATLLLLLVLVALGATLVRLQRSASA